MPRAAANIAFQNEHEVCHLFHGMVHLHDGTTLMQMSAPDMAVPIRWALTAGNHDASIAPSFDPLDLSTLEFAPVDSDRFPFVELGFEVIRKGGAAGCVLNAADEVCVQAFLTGRIPFLDVDRPFGTVAREV